MLKELEDMVKKIRISIGDYKIMKWNVNGRLGGVLASFNEQFTFERPFYISLASKGWIASLQTDVNGTKMDKGKKRFFEVVKETSKDASSHMQLAHRLISTLKQKQAIFFKIPKMVCNIFSLYYEIIGLKCLY